MSCALLGEHFDIHGGGMDLQFPHHENEIAQSEGAFGNQMVNYWVHNGFVRVDNEKMSKSLGNFFTIRDVLKKYDGEVIRFFVVRAHYRSPINYADTNLDDAKAALTRLYTALADVDLGSDTPAVNWDEEHAVRFREAMDDDFNTPLAVAELFDLANQVNKTKSVDDARQLKALAGVLGLLQREPQQFLRAGVGDETIDEANILEAIEQRKAAKKARDFAAADRIRADLLEAGVILEDKPDGTTNWRRA
jgi:cysteinyl-tRNA synthetase